MKIRQTIGRDMKKKTKSFFDIFAGELVVIATRAKVTEREETEEGIRSAEEQLTVAGYLMEEDDQYYYLGEDPMQICTAVKKDEVIIITIAKATDIEDSVLEGIPDKPKGEWN